MSSGRRTCDFPIGIVVASAIGPVPVATVATLDLAGENADRALAVLPFFAGGHQSLDHLEDLPVNDGFMVMPQKIFLRDRVILPLFTA